MTSNELGSVLKARRKELGLTLLEIANRMGVREATVQRWESGNIKTLRYGRIRQLAEVLGIPPSVLVGYETPEEAKTPIITNIGDILEVTTHRIPLVGDIACGEPVFADEDYESYVEASTDIRADFALRAKGDSMIGANIYDGYIVFIRKQPMVDNGEIAAVILDDEATLKRVYRLRDGTLELRSENPKFPPIHVGGEGETRIVRILGKAIAFQGDVV